MAFRLTSRIKDMKEFMNGLFGTLFAVLIVICYFEYQAKRDFERGQVQLSKMLDAAVATCDTRKDLSP